MDIIEFKIHPTEYGMYSSKEAEKDWGTDICINGVDLISLLKEHELPFAIEEGHPDLAGQYAGLFPTVAEDQGYFLGKPTEGDDWDGKTQLYVCAGCGDSGCWPMLVRIEARDDSIRWSDFEQPHRRDSWSYASFGPFVFDRAQYEEALKRFLAEERGWRVVLPRWIGRPPEMKEETVSLEQRHQPEEVPLCLCCLQPMDPWTYHCPHCAKATTPRIPSAFHIVLSWLRRRIRRYREDRTEHIGRRS